MTQANSVLPTFTLQIFTRPSHGSAEKRLSENLYQKWSKRRWSEAPLNFVEINKLASLEATLVQNSAQRLAHRGIQSQLKICKTMIVIVILTLEARCSDDGTWVGLQTDTCFLDSLFDNCTSHSQPLGSCAFVYRQFWFLFLNNWTDLQIVTDWITMMSKYLTFSWWQQSAESRESFEFQQWDKFYRFYSILIFPVITDCGKIMNIFFGWTFQVKICGSLTSVRQQTMVKISRVQRICWASTMRQIFQV